MRPKAGHTISEMTVNLSSVTNLPEEAPRLIDEAISAISLEPLLKAAQGQ